MSDATPTDEPTEVEALTDEAEAHEGGSPADTDATGQPVEEAGTGTADTSDEAELDAPD